MIYWNINNIFFKEEYRANNNLAKYIKDMSYDEISNRFTGLDPKSIEHTLKINNDLYSCFIGKGIDLGGGVSSVSSVIAKSSSVDNIICLEIAENCVKYCHPKVKKKILGNCSNKVISVVGEFDNIEQEENSLDFAIAWDSLHHSNDLIKTLTETWRVLKKNGHLIIIDRAHQNNTSEEEINRMLNIQYSKVWLRENYLPQDKIITRKDNGEHEYRFRDWENYIFRSKFKIVDSFVLREKGSGKDYFENDSGLREYFIDYNHAGFEKRKVVYFLRK